MYKNKHILAIIPARGGSKRIPNKNRKRIAGKPLITYTLEAAKKSEWIDKIVVSSDSDFILDVCREYNCIRLKRPTHLGQDNTPTIDVLIDVIQKMENKDTSNDPIQYDIIILLQPTSPLRTHHDIDNCIKKLVDGSYDTVCSITKAGPHSNIYFAHNSNDNDDNKLEFKNTDNAIEKGKREHYKLNGAVWVINKKTLSNKKIYGERIGYVVMEKKRSIDIDTMEDWIIAQHYLKKKPKPISIGGKKIGENYPVFIIAEAGVNHNGDIQIGKKLIDIALSAGADAIKFQTFNPLTGTSKSAEKTTYQKENDGVTGTYRTMLQQLQLSEHEFKILRDYAEEKGILFMSTASDHESLEIVKKLNVPAFKIGSAHITNIPLIKETARCQKPMIVSVGMATYEEIDEAFAAIKSTGNTEIILLHCVSQYPTNIDDANLKIITKLQEEYPQINIGYSDHTIGNDAAIAAIARGACVIERHITLDKKMIGPDHKASLEKEELINLVKRAHEIKSAQGTGEKNRTPGEEEVAQKARRSIFTHKKIEKNTIITKDLIRMKKPEQGIKPKYLWDVLGKKAKRDIEEDTALQWEDLI